MNETSTPPTSVCDGKNVGQCNSGQILLHYAAVNPACYAAGRCVIRFQGWRPWPNKQAKRLLKSIMKQQ